MPGAATLPKPTMRLPRPSLALLTLSAACLLPFGASAQDGPARTRVVVLGVTHSSPLVSETQRPALFRAFFERVDPDAVAIERDPQSFARNDVYDFATEAQDVVIPWARERGLPVYPIDWLPPTEDQRLLFGVDLEAPPLVRPTEGFGGFFALADSSVLTQTVLYADSLVGDDDPLAWADAAPEQASVDGGRRLFLYRTFLQARRVLRAAQNHPGGVLLVVVGHLHKPDIERILAGYPTLEVVAPSTFGAPTKAEAAAHEAIEDAYAVATFTLLGVQPRTSVVDYGYVGRALGRLAAEAGPTPEVRLFQARLGVLTGAVPPETAAERYRLVEESAAPDASFTWTGAKDRSRLDSFFDPFGTLTVRQRAAVERARALYRLDRAAEAEAVRDALAAALPAQKAAQLRAYWPEHVRDAR